MDSMFASVKQVTLISQGFALKKNLAQSIVSKIKMEIVPVNLIISISAGYVQSVHKVNTGYQHYQNVLIFVGKIQ